MSKLINCPDCGHQVSSKATACPKCGRNLSKFPIVGAIGIVFLGIFGTFLYICSVLQPIYGSGTSVYSDVAESNSVEQLNRKYIFSDNCEAIEYNISLAKDKGQKNNVQYFQNKKDSFPCP